jgi:hypothetical protein
MMGILATALQASLTMPMARMILFLRQQMTQTQMAPTPAKAYAT